MHGIEKTLENVKSVTCRKEQKGYTIQVNGQEIPLPIATNFEVRMEEPIEISHLYFGSETGEFKDNSFSISLASPYKLQISNPDARCYLLFRKQEL